LIDFLILRILESVTVSQQAPTNPMTWESKWTFLLKNKMELQVEIKYAFCPLPTDLKVLYLFSARESMASGSCPVPRLFKQRYSRVVGDSLPGIQATHRLRWNLDSMKIYKRQI
jgi:hypothetical protein